MQPGKNQRLCPRCERRYFTPYTNGGVPTEELIAFPHPAKTRAATGAFICDPCGTEEMIEDMVDGKVTPASEWPVEKGAEEPKAPEPDPEGDVTCSDCGCKHSGAPPSILKEFPEIGDRCPGCAIEQALEQFKKTTGKDPADALGPIGPLIEQMRSGGGGGVVSIPASAGAGMKDDNAFIEAAREVAESQGPEDFDLPSADLGEFARATRFIDAKGSGMKPADPEALMFGIAVGIAFERARSKPKARKGK